MKSKKLLILASLLCLVGCKKSSNLIQVERVYNINNTIELSAEELQAKLAYKDGDKRIEGDDFILYVYEQGCGSCEAFTKVINAFVIFQNAVVYRVNSETASEVLGKSTKLSTNPRLILYRHGSAYKTISQLTEESVFSNYNAICDYITQYCYLSNKIEVTNTSDLDEIIKGDAVVYYGWSSCGDCAYLDSNKLGDYINSSYKKFYYFDTKDVRKDTESWKLFVEKYGLNINDNGGKVPTFLHYFNGEADDYAIYMNDVIETVNNKVTVKNTSYNESSDIIGKTFNSYSEYQKGVEKYHNAKLDYFFNKYLKVIEG